MGTLQHAFEHFYTRDGFNSSLGHFQAVANIIPEIQSKRNLADILNEAISESSIAQNQVSPIVYALLVDKYGYASASNNMPQTLESFDELCEAVKTWNAVDMVITYIHPELGIQVINPKNIEQWEAAGTLRKNELVTVYAGGLEKGVDSKIADKAVETLIKFLNSKAGKSPAVLLDGGFKFAKPKKAATAKKTAPVRKKRQTGRGRPAAKQSEPVAQEAPARENSSGGGKKRMTPLYSVPVSNELFHNGNVEAWKRIIQSYKAKHPGLDVYIFYEGERIHDIHALFKWGKVKHGSTIVFAVAGEDIKDVAKLQRYLRQGASPRFEDFLRFPVNTVLNLF